MWFGPNSIKALNKGQTVLPTPESDLAAVITEITIPHTPISELEAIVQADRETAATLAAVTEESKQRDQAPLQPTPGINVNPVAIKARSIDAFFTQKFESINRVLPYKNTWANATGYFDHLLKGDDALVCFRSPLNHERLLAPGELAKSTDEFGRRIIIIGTNLGPVAIFERFKAAGPTNPQVYVANTPTLVRASGLLPSGVLSEDTLRFVLGDANGGNLGETLSELSLGIFNYYNEAKAFEASITPPAVPPAAAPDFGKI